MLAVGALTLRRTQSANEVPFAAIPAIFALQQFVEGSLWLALPASSAWTEPLTITYLVFSNIFWPVYVPLAVLMIEPDLRCRKQLLLPIVAGFGAGAFFLLILLANAVPGTVPGPIYAEITGSHIHYILPHSHDRLAFAFYAAATCLAPILSSHRLVKLFGVLLIASMIATYAAFTLWFASVWCFFAALLSGVVYLHVRSRSSSSDADSAPEPV